MGRLKTYRDTVLARLRTNVTQAKLIAPTANPKLSMGLNDWPSPAVWLEIESIVAARPELLGPTIQQEIHCPVNVYVAVRLGTRGTDPDVQELEYNEEAVSIGTFDVVDAIVDCLQGFKVQDAPIVKLILISAMEWAEVDGSSVWKVALEMTGGYLAH